MNAQEQDTDFQAGLGEILSQLFGKSTPHEGLGPRYQKNDDGTFCIIGLLEDHTALDHVNSLCKNLELSATYKDNEELQIILSTTRYGVMRIAEAIRDHVGAETDEKWGTIDHGTLHMMMMLTGGEDFYCDGVRELVTAHHEKAVEIADELISKVNEFKAWAATEHAAHVAKETADAEAVMNAADSPRFTYEGGERVFTDSGNFAESADNDTEQAGTEPEI